MRLAHHEDSHLESYVSATLVIVVGLPLMSLLDVLRYNVSQRIQQFHPICPYFYQKAHFRPLYLDFSTQINYGGGLSPLV